MQIKSFTGTRTLEASPVQSDATAIHVRFTNNNNYRQPDYGNFSRKDFVALVKDAGITAEDFREPSNVDIIEAMPVGTHFVYDNTIEYAKVSATQVVRVRTDNTSDSARAYISDFADIFRTASGPIKIKE